ncbi:MAG: hydroxyacid dehydrogenase [Candidatus Micrarchaeota archaeon]|nr:hydroxyacid dehydrogenase [Candidatus Micrarchaeota archaeon]
MIERDFMKIVIADAMEPEVISEIKKLGETQVSPADLPSALKDAEVLVVRSATKVTEELLTHAPKLRIVARAGVGLDNVDAEACARRKIKVMNTPGASSNSVAELALGMMFAFSRRIPRADSGMKAKKWLKKELTGTELMDKTLGLVGFGRIGTMLAMKAKALGMRVIYYDTHHAESIIAKGVDLDELLASSDFISLHVPLLPSTQNMINAAAISKMKKNAFIINTARGGLIDEEALADALSQGRIAGAALDVYSHEPYIGPLCGLENIILTPHIAGSTKEAQVRIGQELVQKLIEELK